jgi:serine/threonine protein kinase
VARFRIGTAFLRRYVLLGPIGHGGVSVVYQALDTVQGRQTAIKMLDPTLAGDPHAQERIRREALITDRVRHPSVPRIYDYGDAPLGDGNVVPYVVLELLIGTVLATRLDQGALPWRVAVRVAATVADVLVAAHRRGVVHRDLTPANIMITKDGAKIIDFGVAVTVKTPDPGKGPFLFAPPEQLTNDFAGPGEPPDDVYALGVLLYQMITGRSPYPSTDAPPPIASATMRWVAPTPVLAVPGLPKGVAETVRSCMAKRPADRPDAASVALNLWSLIVPPVASAPPLTVLPAATQVGSPEEPTVRLLAKPPSLLNPPAPAILLNPPAAAFSSSPPPGVVGADDGSKQRRRHPLSEAMT